ncbi:hypothetical protein [Methylobacterium sp. J-076]|uniref:hypothetical protein n=1 Tax=Methylobacterium sp. J-076 TaxID=2836655 RepID=UPI001FB96B08|nr:hypothetical protein [Methylobacterium sp. J-076]MCJ2015765.1 hypothetical protein [Methylobacterium sp. J-076]
MTASLRLALACAALLPLSAPSAWAQTAFKLDGTCDKLVVAGRDVSAQCGNTLLNAVSRNRTTFDFTTKDGQVISFSGNGAQQEATEETDPLQPINVVSESKTGSEVGAPVLAIGACRFTAPEKGRTSIECEAKTADGRVYAGTFVTAAKAAPGAPGR